MLYWLLRPHKETRMKIKFDPAGAWKRRSAPSGVRSSTPCFPPLGLATLAAFCAPEDEVSLWDEHVERVDAEDRPDLAVIETYITNAHRAYELADRYPAARRLRGPWAACTPRPSRGKRPGTPTACSPAWGRGRSRHSSPICAGARPGRCIAPGKVCLAPRAAAAPRSHQARNIPRSQFHAHLPRLP